MKFCDESIQKHLLNGGKIKRTSYVYSMFLNEPLEKLSYKYKDKIIEYSIAKDDLIAKDWEIVEPEYNWDKIIEDKVLCVFSNDKDFKNVIISMLKEKNNDYYSTSCGFWYDYCKPFNPADFNIIKDLKEYEE